MIIVDVEIIKKIDERDRSSDSALDRGINELSECPNKNAMISPIAPVNKKKYHSILVVWN